jgi:hypothetical protein
LKVSAVNHVYADHFQLLLAFMRVQLWLITWNQFQRFLQSWLTAQIGISNSELRKSKGMTLYSLSGHVANPGQFEAPLGITLRQLLDMSGGMRAGHKLKFWNTWWIINTNVHRRAS